MQKARNCRRKRQFVSVLSHCFQYHIIGVFLTTGPDLTPAITVIIILYSILTVAQRIIIKLNAVSSIFRSADFTFPT